MSLSRTGFLSLLGALGVATPARAALPPWYPLPPPLPLAPARTRRALVLSGGGARGAYEAGVIKRLYRDVDTAGPPFDLVCGTSAGAINAAFAARASGAAIAEAEAFWRGMPAANIFDYEPQVQNGITAVDYLIEANRHGFPRKLSYLSRANRSFKAVGPPDNVLHMMGIVKDDAVQALTQRFQMSLDQVKLDLIVTATNITVLGSDAFYQFNGPGGPAWREHFLGRATIFATQIVEDADPDTPRDQLWHRYRLTPDNFMDVVTASAAVPGVFKPVSVTHGETGAVNDYVDGGVANNIPVGLAVDAGATDVTVVMVNAPEEIVPPPPDTVPKLLQACLNLMQRQILENDIRLVFTRNLLSRHPSMAGLSPEAAEYERSLHITDWKPVRLHVIRPAATLDVTVMGFDDAQGIDAAIELGYQDADNSMEYSA
jgi:predicted acylesterase/phospholipase RssA